MDVFCDCGTQAACRQVKKEGKNQGKWFFCCETNAQYGGCGFFKWAPKKKEKPASPRTPPLKPVKRNLSATWVVDDKAQQPDEQLSPKKRVHVSDEDRDALCEAWSTIRKAEHALRKVTDILLIDLSALEQQDQ